MMLVLVTCVKGGLKINETIDEISVNICFVVYADNQWLYDGYAQSKNLF